MIHHMGNPCKAVPKNLFVYPPLMQCLRNNGAKIPEITDHGYSGKFHGVDFTGGTPFRAADDRAGVAHAFSGRGSETRNKTEYGFFEMSLDILCGLLFSISADFTDKADSASLVVFGEQLQKIDKVHAANRVAAYADAGALAYADARKLVHGFIGQGPGTADDSHRPLLMDIPGHDAHLAFFCGDDTRAVGPDHERPAIS